jgi:hypothetical protein
MERPDKSAAEFWPILNKKGRTLKNCFPPHILPNSREVQESFPPAQTKIVFLKPKFLQKFKTTGGPNFP